MVKQLVAGIALFLCAATAAAQHRMTVEVFNDMGPLTGASVRLSGTPYTGQTDAEGRVFIRNLKLGTYSIEVRYLGYQQQSREVILPSDQPIRFVLERAALMIDRKSTRLKSSHVKKSYAGFCLKKKE